jgi:hypothetical protein
MSFRTKVPPAMPDTVLPRSITKKQTFLGTNPSSMSASPIYHSLTGEVVLGVPVHQRPRWMWSGHLGRFEYINSLLPVTTV